MEKPFQQSNALAEQEIHRIRSAASAWLGSRCKTVFNSFGVRFGVRWCPQNENIHARSTSGLLHDAPLPPSTPKLYVHRNVKIEGKENAAGKEKRMTPSPTHSLRKNAAAKAGVEIR
jgi:hypothetical protein